MHRPRNKRRKRVFPLASANQCASVICLHKLDRGAMLMRPRASHKHTHTHTCTDTQTAQLCRDDRYLMLHIPTSAHATSPLFRLYEGSVYLLRKRIMTERNFTFSLRPPPPPPLELAFDLAAGDRCHGARILENLYSA